MMRFSLRGTVRHSVVEDFYGSSFFVEIHTLLCDIYSKFKNKAIIEIRFFNYNVRICFLRKIYNQGIKFELLHLSKKISFKFEYSIGIRHEGLT